MTQNHADRGRHMVALIAKREIITRLRSKALYATTGLMVVAVIALGIVAQITGGDGTDTLDVGVVSDDEEFATAVTEIGLGVDIEVEVSRFPDSATARAGLDDGDVETVVDVGVRLLLFDDEVDDRVVGLIQQAWATTQARTTLVDAGLAADEVTAALAPEPLTVEVSDDDETSEVAIVAGMVAGILLFISVQTFGAYVLTGVVEEKSSAVVEVLLVRTTPRQLLAGKVIGIGLVALGQFLTVLAAAGVSLAVSGTTVPGDVWATVPTTALWFLGGYTMYSMLFGLAGSLVSRQEDAQAAAAPVSTLLIGSYVLIFTVGFDAEGTATTVLSMVPFVAPLLMPMRMAAGAATVTEVVIAFGLVVATTWLIWLVASRIYEQVLLRRGTRISWRAALHILRTTA